MGHSSFMPLERVLIFVHGGSPTDTFLLIHLCPLPTLSRVDRLTIGLRASQIREWENDCFLGSEGALRELASRVCPANDEWGLEGHCLG